MTKCRISPKTWNLFFKTIRMLELKNTITEIKNSRNSLNRLDTVKERINDLENL